MPDWDMNGDLTRQALMAELERVKAERDRWQGVAAAEADATNDVLRENARLQAERDRLRTACSCLEPDPVMQADGKFYCHRCSFETGARPASRRGLTSQANEKSAHE